MIVVECGLKKDLIINLLTSYKGELSFSHISTEGMIMKFEVTGGSDDLAVSIAKKLIKADEIGRILYVNVRVAL
jgi:hypothetical protein